MQSHFLTNDEAKKAVEENHAGCHESVAYFAEELTTDTTEIPESLAFYIDYEKMGRDLELGGSIFIIDSFGLIGGI